MKLTKAQERAYAKFKGRKGYILTAQDVDEQVSTLQSLAGKGLIVDVTGDFMTGEQGDLASKLWFVFTLKA